MNATAAIAETSSWQDALADVIERMEASGSRPETPDLAVVFASTDFRSDFPDLLAEVRRITGCRYLIGCSGAGIIGPRREIEGQPALSLLLLELPGVELRPARLTQAHLEEATSPDQWVSLTGVRPDQVNGWLLFADPYRLDCEALVAGLNDAYPDVPIIGGLASGDPTLQRTYVFLDDRAYDHGAVALAIGGAYTVKTVVSQGAAPIGEPWTVTGARGHVLETISLRPAYEMLVETFRSLSPDDQERARRNLLLGLAIDERKTEFRRGDFLIRNLMGADPNSGALAIGAYPRIGQTIQFQMRDAEAADEDLRELLDRVKRDLADTQPVGAILCSCNGRGAGLFGAPDHDARALTESLGPVPTAGFFCNGEIGPVGGKPFLHGFTASIALIVPTS